MRGSSCALRRGWERLADLASRDERTVNTVLRDATNRLKAVSADEAAQENVQAELKYDQSFLKSEAPHFVTYVLGQLEKTLGSNIVQRGGLAITTTRRLRATKLNATTTLASKITIPASSSEPSSMSSLRSV